MKNIAIDIVEIARISLEYEFLNRFFTIDEIQNCIKLKSEFAKKQFLAGRWALKEVLFKVLPNEHLNFKEIVIEKNKFNQPTIKFKKYKIRLSLSHNNLNAVAVAIIL